MVLYRTSRPHTLALREAPEAFSDVEFRQIEFRPSQPCEGDRFAVEASHGWWNARSDKPVDFRRLYIEFFKSFDDAEFFYERQLRYAVREGLIHSFTRVPFPPDFVSYKRLRLSGGLVRVDVAVTSPLGRCPKLTPCAASG